MSNPDSSTPSIKALNLAVKPAGYSSWDEFDKQAWLGIVRTIALAYAADLDKADKVGRYHVSGGHECWEGIDALAQSLILRDPIDPDLLEADEKFANPHEKAVYLAGIKRGRELVRSEKTVAQRQAREVMNPKSGWVAAGTAGMIFNSDDDGGRELAKEQDRG